MPRRTERSTKSLAKDSTKNDEFWLNAALAVILWYLATYPNKPAAWDWSAWKAPFTDPPDTSKKCNGCL